MVESSQLKHQFKEIIEHLKRQKENIDSSQTYLKGFLNLEDDISQSVPIPSILQVTYSESSEQKVELKPGENKLEDKSTVSLLSNFTDVPNNQNNCIEISNLIKTLQASNEQETNNNQSILKRNIPSGKICSICNEEIENINPEDLKESVLLISEKLVKSKSNCKQKRNNTRDNNINENIDDGQPHITQFYRAVKSTSNSEPKYLTKCSKKSILPACISNIDKSETTYFIDRKNSDLSILNHNSNSATYGNISYYSDKTDQLLYPQQKSTPSKEQRIWEIFRNVDNRNENQIHRQTLTELNTSKCATLSVGKNKIEVNTKPTHENVNTEVSTFGEFYNIKEHKPTLRLGAKEVNHDPFCKENVFLKSCSTGNITEEEVNSKDINSVPESDYEVNNVREQLKDTSSTFDNFIEQIFNKINGSKSNKENTSKNYDGNDGGNTGDLNNSKVVADDRNLSIKSIISSLKDRKQQLNGGKSTYSKKQNSKRLKINHNTDNNQPHITEFYSLVKSTRTSDLNCPIKFSKESISPPYKSEISKSESYVIESENSDLSVLNHNIICSNNDSSEKTDTLLNSPQKSPSKSMRETIWEILKNAKKKSENQTQGQQFAELNTNNWNNSIPLKRSNYREETARGFSYNITELDNFVKLSAKSKEGNHDPFHKGNIFLKSFSTGNIAKEKENNKHINSVPITHYEITNVNEHLKDNSSISNDFVERIMNKVNSNKNGSQIKSENRNSTKNDNSLDNIRDPINSKVVLDDMNILNKSMGNYLKGREQSSHRNMIYEINNANDHLKNNSSISDDFVEHILKRINSNKSGNQVQFENHNSSKNDNTSDNTVRDPNNLKIVPDDKNILNKNMVNYLKDREQSSHKHLITPTLPQCNGGNPVLQMLENTEPLHVSNIRSSLIDNSEIRKLPSGSNLSKNSQTLTQDVVLEKHPNIQVQVVNLTNIEINSTQNSLNCVPSFSVNENETVTPNLQNSLETQINLLDNDLEKSVLTTVYKRFKQKISTEGTDNMKIRKPDKLDNFLKSVENRKNKNKAKYHQNSLVIKRYRKGKTKIYKLKKLKKKYLNRIEEIDNENLNFQDLLKKVIVESCEMKSQLPRYNSGSSVSTSSSYVTDDAKSEVLSTGSTELTSPQQRLREGFNELSKDKSLCYPGKEWEDAPEQDKEDIKVKIQDIFFQILENIKNKKTSYFRHRRQTFNNCIFKDERLQFKPMNESSITVISSRAQRSKDKYRIMLYILNKIQTLLETDTKLTKRELYYQLKTLINNQGITDRAINAVSCLLDVGMWTLNIIAQKGLVYGDLKLLLSSGEMLNCNIPGILIPQDINDIVEVHSPAYFILVVEKESIFHKLIEEDLPNKLTRPFIMITGKGFPDLNTQLFLRKLWMIMSIPVFILVDADPHGINIMLNYRFGSVNNAHVSQHLAVPHAKWLGVYPSEVMNLNITRQPLTDNEIKLVHSILRTPYMEFSPRLIAELNVLLTKRHKAGIEGLIKTDSFLSEVYLPNKFFTRNFI